MKNIKSFEQFIAENNQEVNDETMNESASISSISNKLEKTMLEMKKTVEKWKAEKDDKKKTDLKDKLKELTEKKKDFEKQLNNAIEELDKAAELKSDEE